MFRWPFGLVSYKLPPHLTPPAKKVPLLLVTLTENEEAQDGLRLTFLDSCTDAGLHSLTHREVVQSLCGSASLTI